MKNLLSKLTAKKLLVVISSFILPIKAILILVGLMILLDTAFGIWAAWKVKEPINSRSLSNIIGKMILYQSAVLLVFALDKFLLGDIIGLVTTIPLFSVKVVGTILVGIELLSINESFKKGTGSSLWTRVKELLKRARIAKGEIEDDIKELKKLND